MDYHPHETACKIAEKSLREFVDELKADRSNALVRVLNAMGRLRGLSWQNTILVAAQRPDATRVASIHAWNDLGRSIKQGEKGILIFASGRTIEQDFRPVAPRSTYVFDVGQTKGRPFPEIITRADISREDIRAHVEAALTARQRRETGDALSGAIEAQADAASYVVMRSLGLETHRIGPDLLRAFCDDPKQIAQTLAVIEETSAVVLDRLDPNERTPVRNDGSDAQRSERGAGLLSAASFARLHEQYHDRVVERVAGMVRDRDYAEDIAARAFQQGWEKRDSFRGEASPYTWIQAIARNAALTHRDRERLFEPIDRDEDARDIPAPERLLDELERRDEAARLRDALSQLPTKYRKALTAHFIDGLSVREIGRRQRIPSGTVLSRIHTGKQLLREAWQEAATVPKAYQETNAPAVEKSAATKAAKDGESPEERNETPNSDPASWER